MTDHSQDHELTQSRVAARHLRLVSSLRERGRQDSDEPFGPQKLPKWAVYLLVAFYCAAVWSLAFWIISVLF